MAGAVLTGVNTDGVEGVDGDTPPVISDIKMHFPIKTVKSQVYKTVKLTECLVIFLEENWISSLKAELG